MISKERLQKFRDIYRKSFGKDILEQEALEKATQLVRLMEIIYKPMTRAELDSLYKRREALGRERMELKE
ncbi:MAG: hypothetical protein A3I31_00530 [Candidatus Colwellbacteria bacterium RIFCSPLOWO2_02_FULL_44_20b]|uniref:Uncharacterized protein n=1 Tax=Candidatus Colwellbacteria bacterium RIFCSPLOWO2_02_FULL_44_20b TaxID=1797691 RepID=A0A1G1Z540_9BACT|nr:MAG: hypothetical protein A3I31_00530 [Candidatus Colwellbacteria bacterium RIFCSPLOWO2_02_FULL_44_20b]